MSGITFLGSDGMYEPINYVGMYSDGTTMVKTPGWERIVRKAHTVVVRPHTLDGFVTAMFLVDAVNLAKFEDRNMSGCEYIDKLILPYLPGARQDRSNPTGDVLFTASSIARMINQTNFPAGVVSLDPHSPVMPNAIDNFREYPLENVIKQITTKYDGIIAPDKGAKNRAERAASALNLPIFYGGKTRDVSTGKLTGFTIEPLEAGNHYLVVDDICDGGGTFVGLGEKIAEQNATADLYVSHGIFSKPTRDLRAVYNQIYTTDSRDFYYAEGVTIIPVVHEMENF